MSSLLTDSEKLALQSPLKDVFDTFKRALVIYQEAQKTIISTNPNYSRFGNNGEMQNEYVENTPVRYTISGCIYYQKDQTFQPIDPYKGGFLDEAQLKIFDPDGKIRIKVDESGYQFLKDAKIVELDGFIFTPDSPPRVHGLFGPNRWTFFYKVSK